LLFRRGNSNFLLALFAVTIFSANTLLYAQDPGDSCDDAELYGDIDGSTIAGSIVSGGAYWVEFTLDGDYESIEISACDSNYDTFLELWGDCTNASPIVSNDDSDCSSNSLHSKIILNDVSAGTYYVAVKGYSTNFGNFTLTISGTAYTEPIANAGGDQDINVDHDGDPAVSVTIDATSSDPNDLPPSSYQWYLTSDPATIIATGVNPTISFECTSVYNETDDIWGDCIYEDDITLKITDHGFTELDTIHVKITEPNSVPDVITLSDEETRYIGNDTGVPGEPTLVNLIAIFMSMIQFTDPDPTPTGSTDQLDIFWLDTDGNVISPVQFNMEHGVYNYRVAGIDPYGATDTEDLTLNLIEQNNIPVVTIAAVEASEIGDDQSVIENQTINLYGYVTDINNDLDGSTSITEDDITLLWMCTHNGNAIAITDETSINASFTSPDVATNNDTESIICELRATDPFQAIAQYQDVYGEYSASSLITITVYNDNSNPVITINSFINPEVNEDTPYTLDLDNLINSNYLSVSDIDNDISFTLEYDDEEDDNYSLSGSILTPDQDFYGEISIPLRVDDGYEFQGSSYNSLSNTQNLLIVIKGVNDEPDVVITEIGSLDEDTNAEVSGFQVSDPDIGGNYPDYNLSFQVEVLHGTITLNQVLGLNFTVGDGVDDDQMVFTASMSNFNSSVAPFTFFTEPDYYGDEAGLILTVNDQGNVDEINLTPIVHEIERTISVSVNPVNDQPVWTVVSAQTVEEDVEIIISGIDVTDIDVEDNSLQIYISATNGMVSLSSTTELGELTFIEGNGSQNGNMSFTGLLSDIREAVSSVTYLGNPDFNGADIISFYVNDLGNVGSGGNLTDTKTIDIVLDPVNDIPYLVFPGDQSNFEDSELTINGVSIADVDVAEGDSRLSVTISSVNGTFSLSTIDNLTFHSGDGVSDQTVSFEGLMDDINNALTAFTYLGNEHYNGIDHLTFTVNDLGNFGSGGALEFEDEILINLSAVNDPPVNETYIDGISSPPQIEQSGIVFAAIPGNWNDRLDTDVSGSSTIIFDYQWQRASDEAMSLGLTFDIPGATDSLYTLSSEDANMNVRLKVTAIDDGVGFPTNESTDAFSEYEYIDNLPPVAYPRDYLTYEDVAILEGAPGIMLNDSDPDDDPLSAVLIQDTDNGTLTLSSDGSFQYVPDLNYYGDDLFTYINYDGALYSIDTVTVTISIISVNDVPNYTQGTNVTSSENSGTQYFELWATDINDGDPIDLQTLTFNVTDNTNPDLFEIQPSLDASTGTLSYRSTEDTNGSAEVTITLNDNGGTANSGIDTTDPHTFSIEIIPVNDPPLFLGGPDITVFEDSGINITEFWATDLNDGDPELVQLLSFEVTNNSNQGLFEEAPAIDADGNLSFKPGENENGVLK